MTDPRACATAEGDVSRRLAAGLGEGSGRRPGEARTPLGHLRPGKCMRSGLCQAAPPAPASLRRVPPAARFSAENLEKRGSGPHIGSVFTEPIVGSMTKVICLLSATLALAFLSLSAESAASSAL